MKVTGIWEVYLPLLFNVGSSYKGTSLTQLHFKVRDVECELLINYDTKIIDKIKVVIEDEYSEEFLPTIENNDYQSYLLDFEDNLSFRAGMAVQDFLDAYSKITNNEYYRIFDGEDFTTKYDFKLYPLNSFAFSNGEELSVIGFDDEYFDKTVAYANKDKDYLDNGWYYLRDAEHFIDIGNYNMAIINMAIMLELIIKVNLRDYLSKDGKYKSKKDKEQIKEMYGKTGTPSFVDKYFKYGLKLLNLTPLDDKTLGAINSIYTIRNDIMHCKNLDQTIIKQDESSEDNDIYDLLYYSQKVYYYFYKLVENKIQ